MSIRVTGRVVGGHLRGDTPVDLPDNTDVELAEVIQDDPDGDDPELDAALAVGAEQLARGEGASWEEVRERLRLKGRDEALSDSRQPSS